MTYGGLCEVVSAFCTGTYNISLFVPSAGSEAKSMRFSWIFRFQGIMPARFKATFFLTVQLDRITLQANICWVLLSSFLTVTSIGKSGIEIGAPKSAIDSAIAVRSLLVLSYRLLIFVSILVIFVETPVAFVTGSWMLCTAPLLDRVRYLSISPFLLFSFSSHLKWEASVFLEIRIINLDFAKAKITLVLSPM